MVRAALPATWGVAIEVPDSNKPPLPVPMAVENTLTPGAVISGLRCPSPVRGPPEVNEAKRRKVGLAIVVLVRLAAVAAFNSAPSAESPEAAPCTPKNGMVTVKGTPVSGLEVIGPSNGG